MMKIMRCVDSRLKDNALSSGIKQFFSRQV
jgi:hypothetical protein